MKKYFICLTLAWISTSIIGCSSSNTKKDSDEVKGNYSEESTQSDASKEAVRSNESQPSAAVDKTSNKKEFYDGIQIALTSSDDASVEKSVANVLSIDQNDSKALNSLALYHLSKNRIKLAKMILKTMVERDPNNAVAINNLGVIYSQQGEISLAIKSFKRALSVNPKYPTAAANLGSIFAVGKDFVKARPYLDVAYRGGIRDTAVLVNYANALMIGGDTSAEGVFNEALKLSPSDISINYDYALFLTFVKKDYKVAMEFIDKIRFMGVTGTKKLGISRMEATINGTKGEENRDRK